jgi:hypothetical protein
LKSSSPLPAFKQAKIGVLTIYALSKPIHVFWVEWFATVFEPAFEIEKGLCWA